MARVGNPLIELPETAVPTLTLLLFVESKVKSGCEPDTLADPATVGVGWLRGRRDGERGPGFHTIPAVCPEPGGGRGRERHVCWRRRDSGTVHRLPVRDSDFLSGSGHSQVRAGVHTLFEGGAGVQPDGAVEPEHARHTYNCQPVGPGRLFPLSTDGIADSVGGDGR